MLSRIVAFFKRVFGKKESAHEKEMRKLREKYCSGYKVLNINHWTGKYNDIY